MCISLNNEISSLNSSNTCYVLFQKKRIAENLEANTVLTENQESNSVMEDEQMHYEQMHLSEFQEE